MLLEKALKVYSFFSFMQHLLKAGEYLDEIAPNVYVIRSNRTYTLEEATAIIEQGIGQLISISNILK